MGILAQDLPEERTAGGQDRLVRAQLTVLTGCTQPDKDIHTNGVVDPGQKLCAGSGSVMSNFGS